MSKITPLPWFVDAGQTRSGLSVRSRSLYSQKANVSFLRSKNGKTEATKNVSAGMCFNPADASFIVKSANLYDELVDACKAALIELEDQEGWQIGAKETIKRVLRRVDAE